MVNRTMTLTLHMIDTCIFFIRWGSACGQSLSLERLRELDVEVFKVLGK